MNYSDKAVSPIIGAIVMIIVALIIAAIIAVGVMSMLPEKVTQKEVAVTVQQVNGTVFLTYLGGPGNPYLSEIQIITPTGSQNLDVLVPGYQTPIEGIGNKSITVIAKFKDGSTDTIFNGFPTSGTPA